MRFPQRPRQTLVAIVACALVLMTLLIGCAKHFWAYSSVPTEIRRKTYFLQFDVSPIGRSLTLGDSIAGFPTNDRADTLFFFSVTVCERDTLSNPRLSMEVTDVKITGLRDKVLLQIGQAWETATERGARGWGDTWQRQAFGPIPLPPPRPDSIAVHAVIVIREKQSGMVVDSLNQEIRGELRRIRLL